MGTEQCLVFAPWCQTGMLQAQLSHESLSWTQIRMYGGLAVLEFVIICTEQ
jgi:hypothetical protein